jgi:hypothetical protein
MELWPKLDESNGVKRDQKAKRVSLNVKLPVVGLDYYDAAEQR